jgi:hypothetical protein
LTEIGSYKAEEYRNLLLFFFPFILQSFENAGRRLYRPERQIFAALAYLVRAYVLPDREYAALDQEHLIATAETLLTHIEANYGMKVMSYNNHQIRHFNLFRKRGNFAKRSAFPAEGMFAQVRRGFEPGKKLHKSHSKAFFYIPGHFISCRYTQHLEADF